MLTKDEQVLDGFPSDDPTTPLDLQPIALQVAELLIKYRAMDHWRRMVQKAIDETDCRHKQHDQWKDEREKYLFQHATARKPAKGSQPPAKDWLWEWRPRFQGKRPRLRKGQMSVAMNVPAKMVGCWMPPHLQLRSQPQRGGPPLPLHNSLTCAERYAVLSAIHDSTLHAEEPICPGL